MKARFFRKALGWLSLAFFLAAYVAPEVSALHGDHHSTEAESVVDLAGPGEAAWHGCVPSDHECFQCLWKHQRDANGYLNPAIAGFANLDASSAPAAEKLSALLPSRHSSCPARAPPSPA